MATWQLSPEVFELIEDVFVWIGFGTVVGMVAKAIMPGRDGGGPLLTLLLGIAGTVLGCGIAGVFVEGHRITPISPLGMVVATGGAFALLFAYKHLGGRQAIADLFPYRDLGEIERSRTGKRYSSAMYED